MKVPPFDVERIINPSQLGGIETSVLDNGPGRGTRIAWVNTGSGLRYKVVLDRGMDIADAFYNAYSLSWHSLAGHTVPREGYNHGMGWLWGFYGGLLATCGATHIGGPTDDHGLHGRISNSQATVEVINQPDPQRDRSEMVLSGTIREARVFGPNIEIHRTISSTLGEPSIRIFDRVTNRGNTPVPHAYLYHINFGYPLLNEGSEFVYDGEVTPLMTDHSRQWYSEKRDYKQVPAPVEAHRAAGEACAYIQPRSDEKGMASVGVVNEKLGLGVEINYNTKEFEKVANWQHWGPRGEYVSALEPCHGGLVPPEHEPFKPHRDELGPAEQRTYHVAIHVHEGKRGIAELRKRTGG